MDRLAPVIRDLRSRLGLTQEEFAHALGITVSTVNRWEKGHSVPSKLARASLARFAGRRGVAVESLLEDARRPTDAAAFELGQLRYLAVDRGRRVRSRITLAAGDFSSPEPSTSPLHLIPLDVGHAPWRERFVRSLRPVDPHDPSGRPASVSTGR